MFQAKGFKLKTPSNYKRLPSEGSGRCGVKVPRGPQIPIGSRRGSSRRKLLEGSKVPS